MVGRTNVGGGSRLHAVIAVTYPEGSICTCTNGTKMLKAKDTSGKALFSVSIGTWTVTATDGNKTKDATVDITTDGQGESVTLKYELVLFDNGAYAEETGGWNKTGNTLIVSCSTTSMAGATDYGYTNNPVDLSGYSTLHFILDDTSSTRDQNRTVGVSNTATGYCSAQVTINNSSEKAEHTMDISTINKSQYVQLYCTAWPNENGAYAGTIMTISKIWLT